MKSTPSEKASHLLEQLIRIPDPDIPIYRIFPVWRLEQTLRLRQLTLVTPEMWDDPFELMAHSIALSQHIDGRIVQKIVGSDEPIPQILGQCWSATEDSDVLWRAYSQVLIDKPSGRNTCPKEEGVQVKSTPRKLIDGLSAGTRSGHCYVGAIRYLKQSELLQEIANVAGTFGINMVSNINRRAHFQLHKRTYFEHESEIRALHVRSEVPNSNSIAIKIEPNEIFDTITFDPRLGEPERQERESMVKKLRYTGDIVRSDIYQGQLLEVVLDPLDPH